MAEYPEWRKARCELCANGIPTYANISRMHKGVEDGRDATCTAPTEAEYIAELEQKLERATDLVRYTRHYLHTADLISDGEFADLVMASGAVQRLEGYDVIKQQLAEARKLADERGAALARCIEVLENVDTCVILRETCPECMKSVHSLRIDLGGNDIAAAWFQAHDATVRNAVIEECAGIAAEFTAKLRQRNIFDAYDRGTHDGVSGIEKQLRALKGSR